MNDDKLAQAKKLHENIQEYEKKENKFNSANLESKTWNFKVRIANSYEITIDKEIAEVILMLLSGYYSKKTKWLKKEYAKL